MTVFAKHFEKHQMREIYCHLLDSDDTQYPDLKNIEFSIHAF